MSAVKGSANRSLSGALALAALVLCALLVPNSATAALSLEVTSLEGDANELQAVYVEATSGQFRLEFGEGGPGISETADIDATATALDVQNALNALDNVSNEGGSVSVTQELEDAIAPFLVAFDGGPLAMKLQPLMRAKQGSVPLAGSHPSLLGGGPPQAYVDTRQPGGVSRSYERIDYTAKVKNNSTTAVEAVTGDVLACNGVELSGNNPKKWDPNNFEPSQYDFRWLRNGVVIPGATSMGYTVTADDLGTALQCIVKGTSATGASAFVSLPAQLVAPASSPPAPGPSNAFTVAARPSISGTGVAMRTCTAPSNWTEDHDADPETAPVAYTGTWSYQWLRNGEEIAGATANTYTPDAGVGGADVNKILQCMVTGKTGTGVAPGGGALVAISPVPTSPATAPPFVGTVPNPPTMNGVTPTTTPSIILNGAVLSAEVELPGPQSFVHEASAGWSCTTTPGVGAEPASAECSSREIVAPGGEGTFSLGIGLGPDLPAITAEVGMDVAAAGSAVVEEATSSFAVEAAREFGIMPGRFSAKALGEDGNDFTQAGGHPALGNSTISFWRDRRLTFATPSAKWKPVEPLRNGVAEIPPGFIGNPRAIPDLCPDTKALLALPPACPPESVVGELAIASSALGGAGGPGFKRMALFAIEPEAGAPAQFASVESFNGGIYVLTAKLRPGDGYAISVEALGVPQNPLPLLEARVTLCSYGANYTTSGGAAILRSCKLKSDPEALEKPFLTTQTECAAPNPVTRISIDSWADPGDYKSAESLSPKMTGCELVPFTPNIDLQPTTKSAESASGLDVSLTVPSEGLEDPDGLSQAHLKKTTVTLPEGMSVNPSAADGLAACTQAQLGMKDGVPNNDPVNCPNASKIGTATVKTPILEETLNGGVYLAKQGDHPFPGDIAAIYVVVESKERGVLIKLPGRVEIRPGGQIVSTFDDNPQAPFSSLELNFHSGPRATLMTPQRCGNYEIVSKLTPWSAADPDNPTPAETVTQTSGFQVSSGPGGGPCPTGALEPKLHAGLTNPLAGASSPFVVNLSRPDGSQRFDGLDMTLPPGLAASLRGVPYCADTTLGSIPTAQGTGQAELDNPSCPAASRLGSVSVGAGAGNPFYADGDAYLAGPYKGAPLSLAVVVPAVAGPFDLGNVVVRNAIEVDPKSAQVSVQSDPIPTHVHNLPVDVRDIRVAIDRPGFMRAPTSCEEMAVGATVSGEDGATAELSNRFQVGECAALGFKPRTSVRLFGGIARGAYQGVRAVVRPRPGDANISRTVVRFPRSAFVAQEHLKDICTRVQYAAEACPKRSVYGRAIAYSPLLDEPLKGNVYLRSSDNTLPDLVADLRGPAHQPIRIEVAVRNDSVRGALRNTVQAVPDAPVSYFRLQTFGRAKGLIVNSRNICKGRNLATVAMAAHNGRRSVQRVNVFNKRCKAYKRKLRKAKRRAKRGAQRSKLQARQLGGR